MLENPTLEIDLLATVLTKPVTQFGVPLVAFYLNVMGCFLGAVFMQVLFQHTMIMAVLFVGLFALIHGGMVWMTFYDPFGLQVAWINLSLFKPHFHCQRWNYTESFSP